MRKTISRGLLAILFMTTFAAQLLAADKYYRCCIPYQGVTYCTDCRVGVGCTLWFDPATNSYMIRCDDMPPP